MDDNKQSARQRLHALIMGRVPEVYQERYRQERIKTNISRMYGLSIYLIIIQIVLNVINILKPASTKDTNINIYIYLSMAVLMTGIVFLIISILCRKNIIKSELLHKILPLLLIYLYVIFQMIFFSLNIQADTGGVNSFVIAVILMCFCMIIKPIHNIINVVVCMFYAFGMMYSLRDQSDAWNSVMITDTWANLIIISVLILFMSTLTYHMYMDNFISKVKLEEAVIKSKLLARTDSLTGIMNRRGFFEELDERWEELKQSDQIVAVAMFDIDFFKAYNDYYGHLAGDNCLYMVSEALQNHFRKHDGILCRFGGEEFLAFFIPRSPEHACQVVEEIRVHIEQIQIVGSPEVTESPYVTISAGFVVGQVTSVSHEELINQADIALYQSKRNGRNMVTEYHTPVEENARHVRIPQIENEEYQGAEKRNQKILD